MTPVTENMFTKFIKCKGLKPIPTPSILKSSVEKYSSDLT